MSTTIDASQPGVLTADNLTLVNLGDAFLCIVKVPDMDKPQIYESFYDEVRRALGKRVLMVYMPQTANPVTYVPLDKSPDFKAFVQALVQDILKEAK